MTNPAPHRKVRRLASQLLELRLELARMFHARIEVRLPRVWLEALPPPRLLLLMLLLLLLLLLLLMMMMMMLLLLLLPPLLLHLLQWQMPLLR